MGLGRSEQMESIKVVFRYFLLLLGVLLGVAFITLFEQKYLAVLQVRVGPNYTGSWGVLQSFADAVKLLSKESVKLRNAAYRVYILSPVVRLTLSLFLWSIIPFGVGGFDFFWGIFFFFCVRGAGVYPILSRGWRSNCVYSVIGSLRSVAQIVSYEVRLIIILLSLI